MLTPVSFTILYALWNTALRKFNVAFITIDFIDDIFLHYKNTGF